MCCITVAGRRLLSYLQGGTFCWWRYGDDEDPPKETKGAYGVDTNWYIDTGATHHITG
jgi:hypothetical protein